MNGSTTNGIQPIVELAGANNNGYAYPVYPAMMGGYGNGGFGGYGSDWIWIILLFALFGGNWGNNGNGGFFGGRGFDDGYAWLSNGQKDIMQNTNNGFDTLHLSNNIEGIQSQISGLSNQLCNCCADVNSNLSNGFAGVNQSISNGFYNSEISANNRQMADMQQNFNNQIATLQGFNGLQKSFDSCCCENRLGIANLTSTVLSENCADREALSNGIRDLITNQTANTQRILDQLCQDKIDAKNEKIVDLQREILMKDLQASQVAQTATLRENNAVVANQLVSELRSCPIPSQPVYGNTPIFTCNGINTSGCGCGNYNVM